ncbi:hypothetical protein K4K48_011406 [Colletotrichum sp. SAR 10_66]|nr:hypothetical protein K4K51_010861 [Colletotrichum sp. SAR 10_75]KAJ5003649.1 hypothetical protein K4K48_011406 [Colletotrichum sp. SAR 10_66]
MTQQTKQDIQDALLRIHEEHPEDWNAFEQTSRQVLAEMGTQRAYEENQAVLNTTQGEADTHSSETNSAQNNPRAAMATASSRASAHANHYQEEHNGVAIPPSTEGVVLDTPKDGDQTA